MAAPPTALSLALRRSLPLLREISGLKRSRSAGRAGSIAERLFAEGWALVAAGTDPGRVAALISARAMIATRLGDADLSLLIDGGLAPATAQAILDRAFADAAGDLDPRQVPERLSDDEGPTRPVPSFVDLLRQQPRSPPTAPGTVPIALEPPENHAEHCAGVAITGALLAPLFDADPGRVFLAGLAHHLHNAVWPDTGFRGEMLLGDALEPLFRTLTDRALATLPAPVAEAARQAMALVPDARTVEGQAFHAADVIDRVLQMGHFAAVAAFTLDAAMEEHGLVHAGPVEAFHHRILAEAGLS